MQPTDTAFGSGFNPSAFRAAITSTMEMGLAVPENERPTFRWLPVRDWTIEDKARKPYNWTATPTSEVLHEDVQIPCAIEVAQNARNSTETTIGSFDTPRATITVLDTHYPLVSTANLVLLGTNTYRIEYWGPPVGLFSVTVYTAYAVAQDES